MNAALHHTHRIALAGAPRTWTGRSALSCTTDSALPAFVTAGTHRTRVSEMRGFVPGNARAAQTQRRRGATHVSPPSRASSG